MGEDQAKKSKKKSDPLAVAGLMVILGGLGYGAWYAYDESQPPDDFEELLDRAAQRRAEAPVYASAQTIDERWRTPFLLNGVIGTYVFEVGLSGAEVCLAVGGDPNRRTVCQTYQVTAATATALHLRSELNGYELDCDGDQCNCVRTGAATDRWQARVRPIGVVPRAEDVPSDEADDEPAVAGPTWHCLCYREADGASRETISTACRREIRQCEALERRAIDMQRGFTALERPVLKLGRRSTHRVWSELVRIGSHRCDPGRIGSKASACSTDLRVPTGCSRPRSR